MSVVKAALPDEDLETLLADEAAQRAPPDAARLPRSFELLAAANEGPSPVPSPGPPAEVSRRLLCCPALLLPVHQARGQERPSARAP